MSKKIVARLFVAQARATVYYDSGLEEYKVRWHEGGVCLDEADYFCDDLEDALGTAAFQCWRIAGLEAERATLQAFKVTAGRTWRATLAELWATGRDTGHLRVIRNRLGPDWLNHPQGAIATV